MLQMLLDLLYQQGFRVPAVFNYYSTRMVFAMLSSLLITILSGPKFIKLLYELKIGQKIRKDHCLLLGKLHHKKSETPTMGGVLMLVSICISFILWMKFSYFYFWILLGMALFYGGIGAYDDYLKLKHNNTKGLSSKKKMLLQLLFATFVAIYLLIPDVHHFVNEQCGFNKLFIKGLDLSHTWKNHELPEMMRMLYIPFYKYPILKIGGVGIIISYLFILFVITGSSNAVNLTDGLDGLASGCLVIVAATLGVFAFVMNNLELSQYLYLPYIEGSGEVGIALAAIVGACLGFLWYNSYPAQIFMGDTGSLSLGGLIGLCALLLKLEILLALVGGVFVIETLSVIIQVMSFKKLKKRVFLCTPIHHHYEYQGIPETKIVIRFWIINLLLSGIGLFSLKIR